MKCRFCWIVCIFYAKIKSNFEIAKKGVRQTTEVGKFFKIVPGEAQKKEADIFVVSLLQIIRFGLLPTITP